MIVVGRVVALAHTSTTTGAGAAAQYKMRPNLENRALECMASSVSSYSKSVVFDFCRCKRAVVYACRPTWQVHRYPGLRFTTHVHNLFAPFWRVCAEQLRSLWLVVSRRFPAAPRSTPLPVSFTTAG